MNIDEGIKYFLNHLEELDNDLFCELVDKLKLNLLKNSIEFLPDTFVSYTNLKVECFLELGNIAAKRNLLEATEDYWCFGYCLVKNPNLLKTQLAVKLIDFYITQSKISLAQQLIDITLINADTTYTKEIENLQRKISIDAAKIDNEQKKIEELQNLDHRASLYHLSTECIKCFAMEEDFKYLDLALSYAFSALEHAEILLDISSGARKKYHENITTCFLQYANSCLLNYDLDNFQNYLGHALSL